MASQALRNVFRLHDVVNVKDPAFGAKGDNATDDTAAIQAAVNALPSGGLVYFPRGTYKITAQINIPIGMRLEGCDRARCIVVGYTAGANMFVVNTSDTVTFEHLSVIKTGVATAGVGIQFTAANENIGSVVRDCIVSGQFRGIQFLRAQQWLVEKCYFADNVNIDVYARNTFNGDSGCNVLAYNTFDNSLGGTTFGFFYGSGGGITLVGNKFLSHSYGIFFSLEDGVTTGIFTVLGNSLEGMSVAAIYMDNAAGTGAFTHVNISDNEIAGVPSGIITAGGSNFLSSVIIRANSISLESGGTGISLSRGSRVYVGENSIVGNGGTPTGITVGSQVSNIHYGVNVYQGVADNNKIVNASTTFTHTQLRGRGTDTIAGNDLTLPSDGDYFNITGNTQINRLLRTNWLSGDVVTLKFAGTPTVKHNQAAGANFQPILLAGGVDFVATANDNLTLRWDGTDNVWYEIGRTVI